MPFQPGQNPHHPPKGSRIKVHPIRDRKAIFRIKAILADKPRDLALFVIGINTAFRAGDLCRINVGDVRYLAPGGEMELREQKTGKIRRVTLNKTCVEAVQRLLEAFPGKDGDLLLRTNRGTPLTTSYVNKLVKGWCRDVGLRGNYGSHSLRKTWGYHQRKTFGTSLPILMEAFGHASQRQTLDYLCIQAQELKDIYANEL